MTSYLYDVFSKELDIVVQNRHAKAIRALCIDFETRKQHPLTLNSQLVGVYPISFTPADASEIFDIFEVSKGEVEAIQNTVVDNRGFKVINRDFNVAGDTLNIFITWLLHLTHISKELSNKVRSEMLMDLMKLFEYKFFTSLLYNSFQYLCKEEVMKAAINRLTKQSDIIRYGTWAKVLEAQAEKTLDGIHRKTIQEYKDDKKIFYLITDTQTRVRDKLKNIFAIFKATKDIGDAIRSHSSTSEMDGTKIVLNQVSVFDTMINGILAETVNIHAFLDDKALRIVSSMFNNIRADMLKYLITKFSEQANAQMLAGKLDLVELVNKKELYVGSRVLVTNIIQKSYRYCLQEQVVINNKLAVLIKLKNIYSSSRISDVELYRVKESVSYFVDTASKSVRESTNSSLKLAFILYIIFKTFKYV